MALNASKYDSRYDFLVDSVSYAENPRSNSVLYITDRVKYLLNNLEKAIECIIVISDGLDVEPDVEKNNLVIKSTNPAFDFARIVRDLEDVRKEKDKEKSVLQCTDGYYISDSAKIGENAYIEAGCYIGHDVIVGDNARIYANSVIRNSVIGNDFVCGEGSVVGGFSFTFSKDNDGRAYRIPSLNKVIIGDDVEIGANSVISTGSMRDTILMDYVKVDAMVHIGHDSIISENVEIAAGATLAGFVEIGENTFVGCGAVIKNRVIIGNNALIGLGAVVLKGILDESKIVGVQGKRVR